MSHLKGIFFPRFRKENLRRQSFSTETYEIRIELLCEIWLSSINPCYLSRGKHPSKKQGSINLLSTSDKGFPGTSGCEKGHIARHPKK